MSAQLIPVVATPAKRFAPHQKLQIIKEWVVVQFIDKVFRDRIVAVLA
jgi:hypothetical protein